MGNRIPSAIIGTLSLLLTALFLVYQDAKGSVEPVKPEDLSVLCLSHGHDNFFHKQRFKYEQD